MRLDIPYCTEVEAQPLKDQIYRDVLQYFDTYHLDVAWKTTLQVQGFKSFRIRFDPFDAKGDPVFLYQQILVPNGLQFKVDWIKNNIEAVLKSIHLVDSKKSYKLEVRESLLERIGKMDASIKRNRLENTPLQKILDEYYHVVLSEQFTVRKLEIDQVDAYCESIIIETYNDWVEVGSPGSIRLNPIFKERLVFIIYAYERNEKVDTSFDWKSSEENLKKLRHYLIQQKHIDSSTKFKDFEEVFRQKPLPDISSPILWVDRGIKNPNEYNTGLLLELIHHLSHKGFIHDKYMNPRNRVKVIEICFRLGNGQSPNVANKRISSEMDRTDKVVKLIDFLDNMIQN